jgi:UDP-N-acetylmuramoyl-tripeptide--D-alanyl-D-alanine ligase
VNYDYLHEMSAGIAEIKTYGTGNAEITGIADKTSAFLTVTMTGGTSISKISTHLVGTYNLPNVLVAVAVGKYFNVPETNIILALENYLPSNSRSQLIEMGNNKIILDAYNANPTSMKAAIENFAKMEGDNKVLLLGGMMELGEESIQEHESLVNLVDQYNWKSVVLVGGDFEKINHRHIYFKDVGGAQEWLGNQHFENAQLLIKGSRSMKMEKVLAVAGG